MKPKMSKVLTPKFRVSFAEVFVAKANLQGKLKYGITMLFDRTADLTDMKQILKEAANAKWGHVLPTGLRLPFRDGNEKSYEGYKDKIFASASSLQKPGLVDEDMNPIISPEDFYSGCYARATVIAFAYDVRGNHGVAFGVQNIQKLDDGEAFAGRSAPEDDFEKIDKDTAQTNNAELFGSGGLNDL